MTGLPPVAILTSGIGLGVYIPALLIERQMRALGAEVDVETLEALYTAEGRERHIRHQQAFHADFALALMGHRMPKSADASVDAAAVEALLASWAGRGLRRFIVWSGFWLPVLDRYRNLVNGPLHLDCCRIDAIVSPSFRVQGPLPPDARDIWLWSWEQRRTVYEIPVDDRPAPPFPEREHRLVVHGGGWGIGTYRAARSALEGSGWSLDTVVHARDEAGAGRPGDRWFAVAPTWRTWQRGPSGRHTFPPFRNLADGDEGDAEVPSDGHALFEVIRRGKAIVSKPGGGTLIDSLASATPVILLDPLGEAEARNGALWEQLGFGVPFATWRDSGFSETLLEDLHRNLRGRTRGGPDYPRDCFERLSAAGVP